MPATWEHLPRPIIVQRKGRTLVGERPEFCQDDCTGNKLLLQEKSDFSTHVSRRSSSGSGNPLMNQVGHKKGHPDGRAALWDFGIMLTEMGTSPALRVWFHTVQRDIMGTGFSGSG